MWEDKGIDKVLKGFLRQILGVNKKTTIMGLRGKTGKLPLSFNIYTQVIKYWIRLLSTESALLQGAHMDNMDRVNNGHNQCWLKFVVYLLDVCGIKQVDVREICKSQHAFLKQIKESLTKLFKESWKTEFEDKKDKKLSFYHEVKRNFQFEGYLDNLQRNDRKETTKFRLSCHNLPVEVMRYGDMERDQRKCRICNMNVVGDEWHYLTECTNSSIEDTREQFILKAKETQPQLHNFGRKELMNYSLTMQDESLQLETALFIKKLLKVYSECKEEEEGTCSMM